MSELVQTTFDYSIVDEPTANELRHHAEAIQQHTIKAGDHVWLMGKEYAEAQAKLANHGNGIFQRWVESETPHSHMTAYRAIGVYEKFDRNKLLQSSISTSALYELARPSTPEPARLEALQRAEQGERITHSAAKEIVADHKEEPPRKTEAPQMEWTPRANELGSFRQSGEAKRCDKCNNLWMADLDYCPYCHISPEVRVHHAMQERNNMEDKPRPHVAHNSGNNEWYTPAEYIEPARRVLGAIDLDPASSERANEIVRADTFYTVDQDGLAQEWHGNVWMNPPYSRIIERFAEKLVFHHRRGDVPAATVLVNNATETNWFRNIAEASAAICFPRNRVRFWSPDGAPGQPLQGQAILYMGNEINRFRAEFSSLGLVVKIL